MKKSELRHIVAIMLDCNNSFMIYYYHKKYLNVHLKKVVRKVKNITLEEIRQNVTIPFTTTCD
jgi:hypothetical protein